MFEIYGLFHKKDADKVQRLKKHLTSYAFFEDPSSIPQLPPLFQRYQNVITQCERVILSFQYMRYHNLPIISYDFLKSALEAFLPVKEKVLVEFSAACPDWNILSGNCQILSNNQAVLKCNVQNAVPFFDEMRKTTYFTYLDTRRLPHIVWIEDTKSLSYKHNLIKKMGFAGICWADPVLASEGNWEALSVIYKQKDSVIVHKRPEEDYEIPFPN